MPVNPVYEKMVNAERSEVAKVAFLQIDRLQEFYAHPGLQVSGVAAVFILLCERFGVSPEDAFRAATNLMDEHDGRLGTEFAAIRQFLKNEVR